MLEVVFLAVALSMDAFAVSVGLGAKNGGDLKKLSLKVAIFFGFFQAIMPIFGFLAGIGLESFIKTIDHWIAFGLLLLIGAKMIYESFGDDIEEEIAKISNKLLLTLAIATSIDAGAAGFTLALLDVHVVLSVVIIGVITFLFSYIGVNIGKKFGSYFESQAEFLGGVVLILIGFKILFEHLGYIG